MADVVSKAVRSRIMARIRARETTIEREFRKKLWAYGLRYRKNLKMMGTPDVAFVGKKVLVFLDSCFWHFCRYHCRVPKSNKGFWLRKLRRNKARDKITTRGLRRLGWTVLRFWEHELMKDPDKCVKRVVQATRSATQTTQSERIV
jgi:DNA mismatch endonuclease (patch repair protein)